MGTEKFVNMQKQDGEKCTSCFGYPPHPSMPSTIFILTPPPPYIGKILNMPPHYRGLPKSTFLIFTVLDYTHYTHTHYIMTMLYLNYSDNACIILVIKQIEDGG